ncbi:hypothetical protein JKI95_06950 [Corynebacterium aquatimens]|uniref:hypothetical protein n=1 Tax=Corynebacterium aquatimens TaxID=1190508 RepID=UPI00254150DC|nr:hypothetical protein [Corynebacterium aquatimens]QYH19026.1 hypothetical protein JKI95_06950 [Corynebacterium aquatimens]
MVYAPGRGYLGVLSGVNVLTSSRGTTVTIQRATFPANGARVSNADVVRWANANLPLDIDRVRTPQPEPADPAVQLPPAAQAPTGPAAIADATNANAITGNGAETGSSAQNIAAIIVGVVGLLAAVVPLLQNLVGLLPF